MSRDKVTDWDTTPALNLDVGGVGIAGTDSAGNISDAFQTIMGQIAAVNAGTAPLDDTVKTRNATDTTKTFTMSAANITTGTDLTIDANSVYRYGAPRETIYTASGTHTFALTTTYFQIEAVGGGGGGGGVDGQGAGKYAAASGGGSGFFGTTGILAKSALLTGAVVIGAKGIGGGSGANGSNGTATTWVDATNSFTWGGGVGGVGITADTGLLGIARYPAPIGSLGSIRGRADLGGIGMITASVVMGGVGGGSPYGTGGYANGAGIGSDASGKGAGGGGAAVADVITNYAGGDGSAGYLIVREW